MDVWILFGHNFTDSTEIYGQKFAHVPKFKVANIYENVETGM
jgi:hypothetical protein